MSRATRPLPRDSGSVDTATLGGLLLALFALPLVGRTADALGVTFPALADIAVPVLLAVVVIAVVVSAEGRPLSSAGIRGPDRWASRTPS